MKLECRLAKPTMTLNGDVNCYIADVIAAAAAVVVVVLRMRLAGEAKA